MPQDLELLAKKLVPIVKHLYSRNGGKLVKTKDIQNYCQQEQNIILFASDVTIAMHIAERDHLIDRGLYTDYPGPDDLRQLHW